MEDIFPLKLRDWYICKEVEKEQVEKKKVDAFQLTVEEKRGEPKFVNRGGVYTVGCIPIILGRRNSFLSAYGISCRWSPFFSQRFFLNVLTCRADWI